MKALLPNEEVKVWSACTIKGKIHLVVITDQRVLLINKAVFSQTVEVVNLNSFTLSACKRGFISTTFKLNEFELNFKNKDEGQSFYNTLSGIASTTQMVPVVPSNKPKKKSGGVISAIVVVFLVAVIVISMESEDKDSSPSEPLTQEEKIKRQFSPWDGSHRQLERLVKTALHDPKSYEHVSSQYWVMKDHIIVNLSYRANNAFGAKVKEHIKAKYDFDGNLIEVVEQY